MTHRTFLAITAALLGIVASAAVAWLASQVAGQRIGLSSEPPSVAAGLVPRSASDPAHPAVRHYRPAGRGHASTAGTWNAPVAPAPPAVSPSSPGAALSPGRSASPGAPAGQHEDSSGGSGSGPDD